MLEPEAKDGPASDAKSHDLTVGSLIASELEGKSGAIGRYDSILWKIRTGYVLALYAGLSIAAANEAISSVRAIFAVVCALSLSAMLIDVTFLWSKLRVVVGKDELVGLALQFAARAAEARGAVHLGPEERIELLKYLRNSGEGTELDRLVRGRLKQFAGAWLALLLYAVAPVLAGIAWAVGVERLVVPKAG